jgi:putative aminopeptidase FrvX
MMNETLKQLTEAIGVSGDEKDVCSLIRDLIAGYVDEWHVDSMGNLIAAKKGDGSIPLRVMIDAHMDEVGLMITGIDRDGTLKFTTVGGFDDRALLGKVVQVGPKRLKGVIGARPIHLLKRSAVNSVVAKESMRIDIGARDKDQATAKVKPGQTAAFVTKYEEIGECAIGKAFDDRAGCAVIIDLLRRDPYPFDVVATFTVQEEVGLRGAGVVSYSVQPDAAFVFECTPAFDQPNEDDVSPNVALGAGPSVYVMDRGTIQDPRLVAHIVKTATSEKIPFQIRQPGGGGTNTSAIQRASAGVPAATIATPARYLHSPVSMINLDDFGHVVELADRCLRQLRPETVVRK